MRFENLSVEHGLSQNAAQVILQDSQGYLWVGTENGLNRYDGIEFKHYVSDRTNRQALSNDYISGLSEDSAGNLWVATDGGGLARWDRATDGFVRYTHQPDNPNSISSDKIRTVLAEGDGVVWVGTRSHGLDRLDVASGEVTHFRYEESNPKSISGNEIFALLRDRAGGLWVGTETGLNKFDAESGTFKRYRHDPQDPTSLSDDRIRAVFEDYAGMIWVGTYSGGISRLDASGKFTRFTHSPDDPHSVAGNLVTAIFEDSDERTWVGTTAGLDLFDRATGRFHHYTGDPTDPASLSDDYVIAIYQDMGGVLWVGTKTGGLNKWNPRSWQFGHRTSSSYADGERSAGVTSFAVDGNKTLWIGTFGFGLTAMDRSSGNVSRFRRADGGISDDRVMALHLDGTTLWVGTMTGGLNALDTETGEVTTYRHEPDNPFSLNANGIMALFGDSHGNLWVGTFGGGAARFDQQNGVFHRFGHEPDRPASLGSDRATSFAEDSTGAIWIGTDGGGLNLLDRATGSFFRFRHNPQFAGGVSSDTIYSLHVDRTGTLWVGTRGGLDRLIGSSRVPERISFKRYSQSDGLPNDVIYGIQSDRQGNLWLSTNNGLSRFNPETGDIKNFNRSHGLQDDEFHFGAHYASRTGELFFGGRNGFNAFDPSHLTGNTNPPEVVLTNVAKFNKSVALPTPYNLLKAIDLGYKDDVVTFEFAALDYTAPQHNQYAYKLEGFDSDWSNVGGVHRVTYTNLSKGDYRFLVRAANSDGIWNDEGLALDLSVAPAPWETWWAYLLYALTAAAALAAVWYAQQRKLARESEYSQRLEREVEERTEKLVEASFTDPLTGLRNRRFLFEQVTKDIALVKRRYQEIAAGKKVDEDFDLAFLMVDLDKFKPINDSFGHAAGDKMILCVRDVLLDVCRDSDYVIRWGGDEFLLVARHTHRYEVEELAERIRVKIRDTTFDLGNGIEVRTTASIGYGCFPFAPGEPTLVDWEQVLGVADAAMYEAKKFRDAWFGFVSNENDKQIDEYMKASGKDVYELAEDGLLEVRSSVELIASDCA